MRSRIAIALFAIALLVRASAADDLLPSNVVAELSVSERIQKTTEALRLIAGFYEDIQRGFELAKQLQTSEGVAQECVAAMGEAVRVWEDSECDMIDGVLMGTSSPDIMHSSLLDYCQGNCRSDLLRALDGLANDCSGILHRLFPAAKIETVKRFLDMPCAVKGDLSSDTPVYCAAPFWKKMNELASGVVSTASDDCVGLYLQAYTELLSFMKKLDPFHTMGIQQAKTPTLAVTPDEALLSLYADRGGTFLLLDNRSADGERHDRLEMSSSSLAAPSLPLIYLTVVSILAFLRLL